jgi:hypothetical protein
MDIVLNQDLGSSGKSKKLGVEIMSVPHNATLSVFRALSWSGKSGHCQLLDNINIERSQAGRFSIGTRHLITRNHLPGWSKFRAQQGLHRPPS